MIMALDTEVLRTRYPWQEHWANLMSSNKKANDTVTLTRYLANVVVKLQLIAIKEW